MFRKIFEERILMTLDQIKIKFKSELQSAINPRSRRYSEEFKTAVRASIHANGYSVASVKEALGVSSTALSKWISSDLRVSDDLNDQAQDDFIAAKIVERQEVSVQRPVVIAGDKMKLYLPNGVRLDFNC
jgi:transposase-like protein